MMDDPSAVDHASSANAEGDYSVRSESDVPSFVFTDKLPLVTDAESIAVESIRALRTILVAKHLQEGRRSLAICAPSVGTGCSFLAANLAVAMAQIGVNTLLVDANLRDPSIHDYITPSVPVLGLGDSLCDDTLPMSQVIFPIQPSLSVLYAGGADSHSQDRIGGHVFKSVMASCLRDYDLTIVDTPPSNRFADARRIASVTRYALVAACRRRTYLKDIHTLLDEFEADRTTVVGTYLNDY